MTPPPPHPLRLAPAVAAAIRAACETAGGAEPCGYLVGRADDRGVLRVEAAWPGRNVHPAPRMAFLLDPDEQLEARRRARVAGLRLLGFWHGHLEGPATPSRADEAGLDALAPGLMLIAGREGPDPPVLRAFVRRASDWTVLPLQVDALPQG